jgi:hypothetical protein
MLKKFLGDFLVPALSNSLSEKDKDMARAMIPLER